MKSGQQYLRARIYDPASGTFNRLDPFVGNLSDPQSLHKYLYAHANPVAFSDPSGHFAEPLLLAGQSGGTTSWVRVMASGLIGAAFAYGDAFLRTMYLTGDIDAANDAAANAAAAGFAMGLAVGMLEGRFTPYIGMAAFSVGMVQAKQALQAGHYELAALDFTLAIFSFFTGVYRPLTMPVRGVAQPLTPAAKAAPSSQPTGQTYSVAYEMRLNPTDYGRSRSVHFNRANASLDAAIRSDPAFAAQMDQLIPGVGNAVSSVGGRATPTGWVWHHSTDTGVLQLVPQVQHSPGSIFWSTMHTGPGGSGGYAIGAIPAGAPSN